MKESEDMEEKVQIKISLPIELLNKLREEADKRGVPVSTYITILLQEK